MKSVEFLIDSRHQAKKLVISTPEKGGQHGPVSFLATKFLFQITYYQNVQEISFPKIYIVAWFRLKVIGNFVGLTDEIGKLCRPNLFSVPVKNIENLIFKLHKSAICRKTNIFGTFWIFFLISMVI